MSEKSAKQMIATNDFISAVVKWKEATARWKKYWFNTCHEIFNACADWAKKYIIDPIRGTIQKIVTAIVRPAPKATDEIIFNADELPNGVQQCYLIRFLDSAGNIVWSKVGTTTRKTSQRMLEHLRHWQKKGFDVAKVVVDRVYNCSCYDAEYYENLFKSFYMKKHPNTWIKNDRFTGVLFDLDEADRMFASWA